MNDLSDTVLIDLPYNINANVRYTNDFEYRACIRKLFCMISPNDIDNDLDEVSRDELNFDHKACECAMDFVYKQTENHPLFQKLYDAGAATMISVDRSIGLSVLFSYDYLSLFHECFTSYLKHPEKFNYDTKSYVCLSKKLS